ncbi:dTDP-4-dehydrorhamnose reductase [Thiohalorhabdus denitrificans]|uniref:dTDP-4-dehydrorhamnose reductase n=1 Tax=Thiohalorhabdus denitrificans TaxID=381306 RepID=A0A0P9EBB8_9GAMM|nr:dTDP-4-dehydrorhamnose reductase [Thiohalorhabdus denitrificans]KPV39575.1 dTDP-4-dehydrorhamnose reductase [Thiohalorhabdus denitrificans]SCX98053.1 dTDP-4-dehydrorhamnose reductase [Thiohalorhabdus denitrificans]
MKILLFGRTGQIGWELERALAPIGQLVSLDEEGSEGLCGDFTRPEALAETIQAVSPDVVVNAAAYTAVDDAESEPETVMAVNGEAPGVLAREARECGAWLVHYSTEYVYDGSGDRPWREGDAPEPLNAYGRAKREGDRAIQASGCKHLILRTSWVYAPRGKNFLRTMLRLACSREALQVIDDQYGAPTPAELVADITAQVLPTALGDSGKSGIYHCTAAGETTWHDYACYLIEQAREMGWPIKVSNDAIAPISTEGFPTAAQRPKNCRLDCERLERTFGIARPDWRVGVERALKELGNRESGQ